MSDADGCVAEGTRGAATLRQQQAVTAKLDAAIAASLAELGYGR